MFQLWEGWDDDQIFPIFLSWAWTVVRVDVDREENSVDAFAPFIWVSDFDVCESKKMWAIHFTPLTSQQFPLVIEGKFNFLFHSFLVLLWTVDAIERAPTHAWTSAIQILRIRFSFSHILVLVSLAFYYFLQTIKERNIIRFISIVEILCMLCLVESWNERLAISLRSHGTVKMWKSHFKLHRIFQLFFLTVCNTFQIVLRLSTTACTFDNDEWRRVKYRSASLMHLCCTLVVFASVGGACLWERAVNWRRKGWKWQCWGCTENRKWNTIMYRMHRMHSLLIKSCRTRCSAIAFALVYAFSYCSCICCWLAALTHVDSESNSCQFSVHS